MKHPCRHTIPCHPERRWASREDSDRQNGTECQNNTERCIIYSDMDHSQGIHHIHLFLQINFIFKYF